MKIALVTPPYNLLKDGYGAKKYSKYGAYPPLGIGYVGAALENTGFDVKIIDSQSQLLNREQIVIQLAEFHAEAVGISAVTACADSACDLAAFIKDKLRIIVFMGGPHPTCFPEAIYNNVKSIDFLVLGEGEITTLEVGAYPQSLTSFTHK